MAKDNITTFVVAGFCDELTKMRDELLAEMIGEILNFLGQYRAYIIPWQR